MSTGQGFAGILMNITRYITLFAFFTDNHSSSEEKKMNKFKESLVFFSFSGFICFLCVICTLYLYRNDYFLRKTSSVSGSSIRDELNDEKENNRITLNKKLLEHEVI
jgi:hypothetical protein